MWLTILLSTAIVFIVVATTKLKLHPFLALLIAAFGYGLLCDKMSLADVVQSVNAGFGGTIGHIGLVILAGSVIGTFLERSGGAFKLAQKTLQIVGQKNVPLAMSIIGYIVSVPVFCDSGFVILSPLAKALSQKAKVSLMVALSLGLYATHTMVPPTPGPLAAAGLLEADLGLVIFWGVIISAISLVAVWAFSISFASRVERTREPASEQFCAESPVVETPSAFKSVIPIFLPIVLIVLRSVSNLPSHPFGEGGFSTVIDFVGQPVVAQLSNMSVKEGYKLQTLGTLVEGSVAAIALWIISNVVL